MRGPLLGLSLSALLSACPAPLSAPVKPVHPVASGASTDPSVAPKRDLGPLLPLGYTADRVSPRNAPVGPDGETDFAFRVRISGDVVALLVGVSDAHGKSHDAGLWDTLPGPEPVPAAWGLSQKHTAATITWAIAVVAADGTLLNPKGPLERKRFDDETLEIFVPDPGHSRFGSGITYTLYAPRPDGTIDRATATIL